jgi:pyruvate formate lyase activating enzyme
LIKSGKDVIVRVPVIPGCNDSPEVINAVGNTALEAGCTKISLLPFNPSSAGKYSWLRREYALKEAKRQSDEEMAKLESLLKEKGLTIIPP